jgi:hypothetical protein
MKVKKAFYMALGLVGTVLAYSQFIPYFLEGGGIAEFLPLAFANRVAAGLALDLLITASAALMFISDESRRLKVPYTWLAILAVPTVGMCLGLPLFLYFREDALERQAASHSPDA